MSTRTQTFSVKPSRSYGFSRAPTREALAPSVAVGAVTNQGHRGGGLDLSGG